MTRILIRSAQDPFEILTPLESTRAMGGNSGNLLYAHGVHRAISVPGATVRSGGFRAHLLKDPTEWIDKVNTRYDHFVVPMSNAFRIGFSKKLEKLASIIERLEIPVTVVGIGAQTVIDAGEGDGPIVMGRTGQTETSSGADAERHAKVVRRFAEAVLARTATIGVRGELTKAYLVSVGVDPDRIDVIGCPSIYTWGPDHRVRQPTGTLGSRAKVSLNVDFRVDGVAAVVEKNAAMYRNLMSPVQDSNSARMIITGADTFDRDAVDDDLPIHTDHELYRSRRLVYFPNPWGWIENAREQDFFFGTRLHGNIAGILGGTPAHLLAHDSRTRELAVYHGIPHTRIQDWDVAPSAAELYAQTDYTEFNDRYPQRFATYVDFLHRNGLATVWDEGNSAGATAFDEGIVAGRKISCVRPATNAWQRAVRRVRGQG